MNAWTIDNMLSQDRYTREHFQGFSTPDVPLPHFIRKPALYILNIDDSGGPGIHWCLAFFNQNNECDFFDPLGNPPDTYNFHHALFEKCSQINFNHDTVQASNSSTCGHHCVFFAYHRSRNVKPSDIMKKYKADNYVWNDHMVNSFIHRHFGSDYAKIVRAQPRFMFKN